MNASLDNRLAECRALHQIKKSQLALYLGKSRAYVTRLEHGDIRPSLEVALQIARHFKKPVESIFQLVEDSKTKVARPAKGLEVPATSDSSKAISRPAPVESGKPTIKHTGK